MLEAESCADYCGDLPGDEHEITMDGRELQQARERLGWSVYQMGAALRLAGGRDKAGTRVREMERDSKEISGPVTVAIEAFLAGFRPSGFDERAR